MADLDLGTNFINLAEVGTGPLINRLLGQLAILGRTPATFYVGRASDVEAVLAPPGDLARFTLDLPSYVTLMIPPGVVLSIAAGFALRLHGPLMAGPHHVFDAVDTQSVAFLGNSVAAIYPEWWGAGSDDPSDLDDTFALQCAFDAAFWLRVQAGLIAIPVELPGWYTIRNPLILGGTEGDPAPSGGFMLRGNYGGSRRPETPPTFKASDDFPDEPMVIVRNAVGFLVESVSMDAGCRARTCVKVEGTVGEYDGMVAGASGCFRMCGFSSATTFLIDSGATTASNQVVGPSVSTETVTIGSVIVSRGPVQLGIAGNQVPLAAAVYPGLENHGMPPMPRPNFSGSGNLLMPGSVILKSPNDAHLGPTGGPEDRTSAFPVLPCSHVSSLFFESCTFTVSRFDLSPLMAGLRVEGPGTSIVKLSNCVLDGSASRMIHALGVALHVEASTFMNSGGDDFVDIYLDYPDVAVSAAAASLTATDCRSWSPAFLSTAGTPSAVSKGGGNSVLIGVTHQRVGTVTDIWTAPASVSWQFSQPSDSAVAVTFLGCAFDGSLDVADHTTRICSVGTRFDGLLNFEVRRGAASRWGIGSAVVDA